MTRYEHIVLEDSFYSGTPSTSGGGWLGTRLRRRAAKFNEIVPRTAENFRSLSSCTDV